MKGIADGAAAAGANYDGRRVDLIDIVVVNTTVELGELNEAHADDADRSRRLHLERPATFDRQRATVRINDHCSAFAACGKATRDGKMVIGHVTWWPLTLAEQTNIMLDRAAHHRPSRADAKLSRRHRERHGLVSERRGRGADRDHHSTRARSTWRARRWRIARANRFNTATPSTKWWSILSARNNGLYTNEWIIGDARTNEIAMLELGTYKTRLYRSSKNDWFGGTEGFYWGCNNAKDLNVRLEYEPDPHGAPRLPFVPEPRDLKWQQLYREHKGTIDEQFGFLAFRTAPLVSASTMDAKVTTSEMASQMMIWARSENRISANGCRRAPRRIAYAKNDGLYASGYRMIAARASSAPEVASDTGKPPCRLRGIVFDGSIVEGLAASRLRRGHVWFTAGSAAYYRRSPIEESQPCDEPYTGLSIDPPAPRPPMRFERFQSKRTRALCFSINYGATWATNDSLR